MNDSDGTGSNVGSNTGDFGNDGDNADNPGGEIGSNTRHPGSDVGCNTGNPGGDVGSNTGGPGSNADNGTGDGRTKTYLTAEGIAITRTARAETRGDAIASLAAALDERLGVLLTSSFEYPGRYTRWDIGFCDPALAFTGRQRGFEVRACNERGAVLLPAVAAALEGCDAVAALEAGERTVTGTVRASGEWFPEELRSKQPTLFSVMRALIDLFRSPEDAHLGLYGAFGYELAFQFDPIRLAMPRDRKERNPAPYGALMHLGEREYLVAASPEMYVRVEGRHIETCPISGTITRGANAIGDAR